MLSPMEEPRTLVSLNNKTISGFIIPGVSYPLAFVFNSIAQLVQDPQMLVICILPSLLTALISASRLCFKRGEWTYSKWVDIYINEMFVFISNIVLLWIKENERKLVSCHQCYCHQVDWKEHTIPGKVYNQYTQTGHPPAILCHSCFSVKDQRYNLARSFWLNPVTLILKSDKYRKHSGSTMLHNDTHNSYYYNHCWSMEK